nr:hypothetical protein [uncultured Campylobacter sp.]
MAVFCLERIWRVCVLYLCLVYLASFGAIFIKFDADVIFYFAVSDISAILYFVFDFVFRAEIPFLSYLTTRCFTINLASFNPQTSGADAWKLVKFTQISKTALQVRF